MFYREIRLSGNMCVYGLQNQRVQSNLHCLLCTLYVSSNNLYCLLPVCCILF